MLRKIKLFCIFAIVVIITTLAFFLISHKEDLLKKDEPEEILKEETVSLLIIEPDYINPLVSYNKYIQEISGLIFDGLTKIDEVLKPQPVLAKTFIPDESLTNWNVALRNDVKFHDGSDFTADDVVFTINKIKELGADSYFSYNVENIESVEEVTDYEVIIKLKKADNFLMNKMTFPILSKSYYSNKLLQSTTKYVGTGAYKQADITDSEMKLVAFEDYYMKNVGNIKNITVKIVGKNRPGFELLKQNEVDIADTNTEVGAYGRSAYNSEKYVTSMFEGIIFNSENEALKDTNVRQAVLLGINRDLIIENFLGGYGLSVDLPVNPNSYLVNKELSKNSFNPERAQDILTNNGWTENLALGCRTKNLLKLQFDLLINSDNKNSKEKAEFIKANLKSIGIDVNIVSKNSTLYNTAISEREYDMALTDWAISEYPEFLYSFETNSKDNIFGFSNDDYDYYVFMAKTEFLEGKTKDYFDKMQEILLRELPMAGIYFETSTVYYSQSIEGSLQPTINNIYTGLANMIKK